ncbi:MAG: GtrA family protein [Bacteroidota bacterium]
MVTGLLQFSSSTMILKFLKFAIVGFSGLIIDFSVTYLLKEHLKIHRYVANSIGFSIAASTNYLLNRYWTFQSENPKIFTEYVSFFIISLIGLALNNLFLFQFEKRFSFYLSKLFAIVLTTLWNFFANYLITFSL